MQIAIFKDSDSTVLETTVNSFLSGLTATTVTVQYQSMIQEYKIATGMKMEYSVMIFYQ